MCSIISCKINKDLTNIIREYLLPIRNELKEKYNKVICMKQYYNEFLCKCYLFQFKRTFPQKEYKIVKNSFYDIINFKISNLKQIRWNNELYIFRENQYINRYISTTTDNICFIIGDRLSNMYYR